MDAGERNYKCPQGYPKLCKSRYYASITAGRSNPQIVEELVLSINAVRRHISNIFDKIGATNRVEAATLCARPRSRMT
jgi:DNA-binding CsgD family transcriptional regulator